MTGATAGVDSSSLSTAAAETGEIVSQDTKKEEKGKKEQKRLTIAQKAESFGGKLLNVLNVGVVLGRGYQSLNTSLLANELQSPR